MRKIDRLHHICLTVTSENFATEWPKMLGFYTDFLRMNAYKVAVEEMDQETSLQSLEDGLGLGKQVPQVFDEDGHMVLEYFYYLAGEDLSETACLIDIIVFLTEPGQLTQPHSNMHTMGLRSFSLLVDNVDAVYERGIAEGHEFVSAPTTQTWGDLGEVRYVVVKDPAGNHVELVQTDEVTDLGDGSPLRIFSINQNTVDMEKALAFYSEGSGMRVEVRAELSGTDFATSTGTPDNASASLCLLKGENTEAKTFYGLTQWHEPVCKTQELADGHTTSYYRMWHWIKGNTEGVQEVWDRMAPQMQVAATPPFVYPSPKPWGDVTMAFFLDNDGVLQEFANHVDGTWRGLEEILDHEDHRDRFTLRGSRAK